jgi:hypothetical protein
MIDDDRLPQLLKAALPSVDTDQPRRDLWPAVIRRSETRVEVSFGDWSLAAIVIVVLLMFPKWFWFLAYHL